jgi:hypothetical protein
MDPSTLAWEDEREFDRIAWHLSQTGQYESSAYRAAPTLPAFLALVYWASGHNYTAARLVQALLGGILVLAVAGATATFFDRRTAYLAALGTAFYPPLIYLSSVLYAEFLFAVLLSLEVLCLARWQVAQRLQWLLGAAVLLGIGALCRPVLLAFVPLAAAYVWWRSTDKRGALRAAGLVSGAVLVILPWTIRNTTLLGHVVPISTGFGLHFWRGNNEMAWGDADDRHLMPLSPIWRARAIHLSGDRERQELEASARQLDADLATMDEVERDRRLAAEGWRWLRRHPARFWVNTGRRLSTLYSAFTTTMTKNEMTNRQMELLAAGSFYPVLILGLVGVVAALRWNMASAVLHAIIAAMTLAYLPMTACTRFRLPIDPLWIALASVTVRMVLFGRQTGSHPDRRGSF